MSRLQAIENSLSSINQAAFQNLCDSFLALRNSNYEAFSRTGSQSGKQKTVKGTPDTFLLLPNGKYIFVEYSTNISAGLSKLEEDIKKCIDTNKTGIPVNQIAEIIICINFNLSAAEVDSLKNILSTTRVALSINTLDSLAIELYFNRRDLAHEYLGLPLDTGQIVSIERFIEEYKRASKGIATPLDNTFLHREKEMEDLLESIHNNDFIIITGPPGIGKTKLALEGIKNFLSDNLSYNAFCISYKSHALLEDLYQYFSPEKDYILFVDDANRIDAFNQITGFYKNIRKGKLKIIVTVRDYAFQDVGLLTQEFLPKRIDLFKFTDAQIIDIIKAEPFKILNPQYHKEIVRIADGNPRLAIMAAQLAIAEQDLYALADVSDLFENYFSTFIKDEGEFAKELNIKCLGLIAFFYTIPYKNKEITTSVLTKFNIAYEDFIDAIDRLDKLELVEIQFDHVKIPEQNLATYFFYKAFMKDNLLSFEILLNSYFDSNTNRFKETVIPANNTFGSQRVMDKLQPDLKNHWKKIRMEEDRGFKFLETFWFYLENECLEFVFDIVQRLPDVTTVNYEVAYENNAFSYNRNKVIELLGEFFRFPDRLKDSIELAFEYTRKIPKHLPELIHKIRDQLTFDYDDARFGFPRQVELFEILERGLNQGDKLLAKSYFELSKTFLSFKFHHTKGGRNHSISWYDYPIPNNPLIQDFRKRIWNAVDISFDKYPDDAFDLLKSYARVHPGVTKEIMQFDLPFLIGIIEQHLSNQSFEDCRYVQDQIRWCKRNSVFHSSFPSLTSKFTNETYEAFLKIDWDRLRDKESFEFKDYKEYERLKESEIRFAFVFAIFSEAEKFYQTFVYLKSSTRNEWNYNTSFDFVVDENCKKNFSLGCQLLELVIKKNNEINYVPQIVLRNCLTIQQNANTIWKIIQEQDFLHKPMWELSFYDHLDNGFLNEDYIQTLLKTVDSIHDRYMIHFDRLKKFLVIEPKLFQLLLQRIVEKNEKEEKKIQLWIDLFEKDFDLLGDDIDLIEKAYLQQEEINSHLDYEGKAFLNILQKDSKFLLKYVANLYKADGFSLSGDSKNFGFIWKVRDIENDLEEVFNFITEKDRYLGIGDHSAIHFSGRCRMSTERGLGNSC